MKLAHSLTVFMALILLFSGCSPKEEEVEDTAPVSLKTVKTPPVTATGKDAKSAATARPDAQGSTTAAAVVVPPVRKETPAAPQVSDITTTNAIDWTTNLATDQRNTSASSSDSQSAPENAFDGDPETTWTPKTGSGEEWLQYDFTTNTVITGYSMALASPTDPVAASWVFEVGKFGVDRTAEIGPNGKVDESFEAGAGLFGGDTKAVFNATDASTTASVRWVRFGDGERLELIDRFPGKAEK